MDQPSGREVDRLVPALYGELRRLAERAMRGERPNHTLQPTALVHGAYLHLAGSGSFEVRSRGALERLGRVDEDQVRIVELRFIAGLSVEETAEALGVSASTVKRETALARAWLYRELRGAGGGGCR
jgi:DNA-directed RNA polymerase specialized sigma24 family protein